MKNSVKYFLIALSIVLISQDAINAQGVLGDAPYNGVYKKEANQSRKPIDYTPLRESDVMWSKRVWRMIDLREKMNLPLYYPQGNEVNGVKNLAEVLYTSIVTEGTLRAYEFGFDDQDFEKQLTATEVEAKVNKEKMITKVDLDDPTIEYDTIIREIFNTTRIKKYLIKEDWFFDKQRSVLDVRIIAICPLYNDAEDASKAPEALFWIYFPHAREVLAQHDVFNRFNTAERKTFDDIFWKRQFSSYIVKEENVYNRTIVDYKTGMDALLEAERIKLDIINFEHDLWEF
jgi:gliding motility associated protien GldN